jgi:serine protease
MTTFRGVRMPPARLARPTRGLILAALAATLLAPTAAAARPPATASPDSDRSDAAGRQPAVAVSQQVVVTWARAGLGATRGQRLGALKQASRTRRVGEAAGSRAVYVRPFGSDATTAVYRLAEPLGRRAGRTLDAISRIPGVVAVEPDPWVTPVALPDDTYADDAWGALGPVDGSPNGIDAVSAWASTTGASVTVAVIDTGWVNHGDLTGQNVAGYDFITSAFTANDGGGRDSNPSDPGDWVTSTQAKATCPAGPSSWHGLHVSGTIAARAGNQYGTFGAAPGAKILPVRVVGRCGGTTTDVADAITWASGGLVTGVARNSKPAKVVNLSLGGKSSCPAYLASAIAGARARGSVVVVAAGNSNADAGSFSPANCPGTLVVAATGIDGTRASFSNFGSIVDIAAPGEGIWSTYNFGKTSPQSSPGGDAISRLDGTSMATPHVSAVAALLLGAFPAAAPAAIEQAIRRGATAFAADGSANPCTTSTCGAGIANAPAALASLASAPSVAITPPTSPTEGPNLAYSLVFGEGVTDLTAADFTRSGTAAGCAIGAPSGGGTAWTVTLTGCGDGSVVLALQAASVTDLDGNAGPSAPAATSAVVLDRTGPQVQSAVPAAAATNGQPAYRITFDEAASGFTGDDLTVDGASTATGCAIGNPVEGAASGMTAFDVQLAGCSEGTVTLVVAAGSVTDAMGHAGPAAPASLPTVTVDTTPPVAGPPSVSLRSGAKLSGTAAPVTVTWSGSDPGGTGVATYALSRSSDGGATWTPVATTGATSYATTAPTTGGVLFGIVAFDRAGNASGRATGTGVRAVLAQQGRATLRRSWTFQARSAFSGGSARWSKTYKASATYTFTGRAVSFVTTRASSRGKIRIYVDGVSKGVYDLRGATAYRWVAWKAAWATSGRHAVKIVVLATPGRPRVDVDAFVVLR